MSGNTIFDYVIEGSECSIQDRIEAAGGKVIEKDGEKAEVK